MNTNPIKKTYPFKFDVEFKKMLTCYDSIMKKIRRSIYDNRIKRDGYDLSILYDDGRLILFQSYNMVRLTRYSDMTVILNQRQHYTWISSYVLNMPGNVKDVYQKIVNFCNSYSCNIDEDIHERLEYIIDNHESINILNIPVFKKLVLIS